MEARLPYQDGGEATVWEHVNRAVDFTLNNRGPHGLFLCYRGLQGLEVNFDRRGLLVWEI